MSRSASSWFSLVVTLLIASAVSAEPSAPEPLELADFAYSIPVTGKPGRAVQSVLVPLDIYLNVLRKDLGDMRVFSQSGREVPHAIRTMSERGERALPSRALPLFPLRQSSERVELNDLEVHVTRGADGSVVDIRSRQADASIEEEEGPIVAYVLDASAAEHPIVSLAIRLGATEASYVFPIQVQASNDLAQWRDVATGQTLARLEFEGNRIEHQQIAISPTRSKYLRLSWEADTLPATIVGVEAQFQKAQVIPNRRSLSVRGRRTEGERGVYEFDVGGFVPADRVRIQLSETNTLIKATLSSSGSPEGPWTKAMSGSVYRINEQGQELTSPSAPIPRSSARFWRMKVHTGAGELERAAPTLTLEYFPEQLIFVSKEQSVHQLAYGSYKAEPSKFAVSDILSVLPQSERRNLPTETATLGGTEQRGGEAAATEPPPPPPIKTYILWAVLILCALILGLLAFRLARNVG